MLRRNLIIGSACLAAAGAAMALAPRSRLSRVAGARLADLAPANVEGWVGREAGGLAPAGDTDDIVAKLYDQVVERIYRSPSGQEIMALFAHGPLQTSELELHRPELCYRAVGYTVAQDRPMPLTVASGVTLPCATFVADGMGRQESVVYWTRIGDALPMDAAAQHMARMQAAMAGYVCDGLLVRFSIADRDPAHSVAVIEQFIPKFLAAVGPANLPAFVGRTVAGALDAARA